MAKRRVKRHSVTQPITESFRLIPLTQGQNAIVDAADFEWLNQWNWSVQKNGGGNMYAARRAGTNAILMHRVILELKDGEEADHENRDSLDNRRDNLRKCTQSENTCNRGAQSNNISRFKGVSKVGQRHWQARIQKKYLGCFNTPEKAATAYNAAAQRLHGKFAFLNQTVPPEPNP